jgi:5-methyltetrahydrofolate corrinoid/iron sulfur protein methyltransferase
MYIIGENIHIISTRVKDALRDRDAHYFQELAVRQVEEGAQALDLNLGPRKKDWDEVFPWMVETVEAVVDVPLSFDSTNLEGIEAGLRKVTRAQPIINSTSAEPERLERVPLVAKKYNARLIALTMGKSGIPVSADERVTIALEQLIPRAVEIDFPIGDLIIDPLVLTVSGCQEYCPELIEAVRTLQFAWDPPPPVSVGLSNVSNAVPAEFRPLINRVYCAMLMGAGLQMMIADPFDTTLKETIRVIEERDAHTPAGALYLKIFDRIAAKEEPALADVDTTDPEQVAIWQTVQILQNKVIYADSYLQQELVA